MSRYFSKLLFSTLFLIACEQQVNTSQLTQELMQINDQQRIAHLTNDAALLASTIADTLVSIQNGSITSASNIEVENKFSQYFASVKYTTWDDTRPPIIELSSDGTLASVSVQKLLDLQQKDSIGIFGTHNYSLFAWTSLFKRVNRQWKMTQITSTAVELTESEALNIPIQLGEDYSILDKPEDRIDGLAYYQESLIANQPYRNRILQFTLNESEGKITSQRILEANHPDFDQPTTGEIAGNEYIYLANA